MLSSPSVLERVIRSRKHRISPEVAEFILSLSFSPKDQKRSERLSLKAQRGTLTEAESAELDDLLTTNDLLTILKSMARRTLQQPAPEAA